MIPASHVGRKLAAAVDLFAIASGKPVTHGLRARVFAALTDDDPEAQPGDLIKLLASLPAAECDLAQVPIPLTFWHEGAN